MPRYFFHLHNDIEAFDDEGRELPNLDAARHDAERDALQMAAESVRHGHLDLSHYVEVEDAERKALFRVTFGEVLTITRSDVEPARI